MGEASRAVDVARGTELPRERPLGEPGDDDIGTGSGRGDEEGPSCEVDILID
jgi:hypothetical protein